MRIGRVRKCRGKINLDFIDLKKLTESRENWKLFKPIFDIPTDGAKGLAKNVDWMERINELRRISAHRSEGRNYKPDDFTFVEHIFRTITDRLRDYDYSSVGAQVAID